MSTSNYIPPWLETIAGSYEMAILHSDHMKNWNRCPEYPNCIVVYDKKTQNGFVHTLGPIKDRKIITHLSMAPYVRQDNHEILNGSREPDNRIKMKMK